MSDHRRAQLLIPAAIVLVACAVRLAYLAQFADDPFFAHPIIDARQNVDDANLLLGSWLGPPKPYWKPPLYSYLLAAETSLFGGGPWTPRLFQVAMDAVSCLLVYGIGVRLFSRRVAIAASLAVALNGAMIYFTGELVSASLVTMLYLLVVRAALGASGHGSPARWLGAGALVGLAAIARSESLLFAPVLATLAFLDGRTTLSPRRRLAVAGAVMAGAILLVAPVTLRNAIVGKDAVLISSNGGINLYIGTAPEYRGMIGVRPGGEWEKLTREPENEGITRSGSRQSSYFVRWALRRVADDPGAIAWHTARKAALFWHGHELMSNRDLYETRRTAPVLHALLWEAPPLYLPFGLLAPLALVGMAFALRSRHASWPLVLFVAIVMASSVVFFVTSRFRTPAVPVIALFAAFAVERGISAWRASRRREAGVLATAVALLAIGINLPAAFAGDRAFWRRQAEAEEHHYRGTVLFAEERRFADAERELLAARALEPDRASTAFNLALTYRAMERRPEAIATLRAMLRIIDERSPGERYFEPDVLGLLAELVRATPEAERDDFARAFACFGQRSWDCAVAGFEASGEPALLARALAERGAAKLARNDDSGAAADLDRARALRPSDAQAHLLFAVAAARQGLRDEAGTAVAAFRAAEWPRGTFYREAARRRAPDGGALALDVEMLRLILVWYPNERLARQALAVLESRRSVDDPRRPR